jgi:hypothetical protein
MSKLDMIETEISRRAQTSEQLKLAEIDTLKAIEQFSKLDEMHKSEEKKSREKLEGVYKELRHFTGKWPKVYAAQDIEYYPFFNGPTDNDCNPYFPVSKVKNKTFDGLGPLYIGPTQGTGTWARDRNYSPSETSLRTASVSALSAFPDISGEVASCSLPAFTSSSSCSAGGGTWGYDPADTATARIRTPLTAWKNEILNGVIPDLWQDASGDQLNFWQNLVSKINDILAAIPSDVSYPNNTVNFFTPGSPADIAKNFIINNANSDVGNRINYLTSQADKEEKVFYSLIKLRLHQANGSFAKIKAAKFQIQTNKSIIKDNTDAIASLNILKVKDS